MEKPIIYIIVQEGLVQDVFVKAPWGANAEVIICDMDNDHPIEQILNNNMIKQLPEIAHHVY